MVRPTTAKPPHCTFHCEDQEDIGYSGYDCAGLKSSQAVRDPG